MNHRTILLTIVLVLGIACSPSVASVDPTRPVKTEEVVADPTAPAEMGRDIEPLLTLLENVGASTAQPEPNVLNEFNATTGKDLADRWAVSVADYTFDAYVFDTPELAQEWQQIITPSGDGTIYTDENGMTQETITDYIAGALPRFWRHEQYILFTSFTDSDLLKILNTQFGQPFAGKPVTEADLAQVSGNAGIIHIITLETTILSPIKQTDSVTGWSPDGTQVLFHGSKGSVDTELYTLNLADNLVAPITDNNWQDWNGVWSPDGTKIAYESLTDQTNYARNLFVLSVADGTTIQLTEEGDNTTPVWSPDGTKIAFTAYTDAGFNIFVVNADGTGRLALTGSPVNESTPVWSADGAWLFFATGEWGGENAGIFRIHPDGTGLEQLVENAGIIGYLTPAPDNTQLAFTANHNSDNTDRFALFVVDLTTKEMRQISAQEAYFPVWSPTGEWIAFTSYKAARDIFMIRPDGTALTRLTNSPDDEWGGIWSPDGTQILYNRVALP